MLRIQQSKKQPNDDMSKEALIELIEDVNRKSSNLHRRSHQDEDVEEQDAQRQEIRGILGVELIGQDQLIVKISLKAAGFILGNKGRSIREICMKTGTQSTSLVYNIGNENRNGQQAVRVCMIKGNTYVKLYNTLYIVNAAAERYAHLIYGLSGKELVAKEQIVEGIKFEYKPPPLHSVPTAARTQENEDESDNQSLQLSHTQSLIGAQLSSQRSEDGTRYSVISNDSNRQNSQYTKEVHHVHHVYHIVHDQMPVTQQNQFVVPELNQSSSLLLSPQPQFVQQYAQMPPVPIPHQQSTMYQNTGFGPVLVSTPSASPSPRPFTAPIVIADPSGNPVPVPMLNQVYKTCNNDSNIYLDTNGFPTVQLPPTQNAFQIDGGINPYFYGYASTYM